MIRASAGAWATLAACRVLAPWVAGLTGSARGDVTRHDRRELALAIGLTTIAGAVDATGLL
jgi:hypothetical protein